MNDSFVRYNRKDIVRILSDLNEIVVSLDRIGSYWSERNSDEEYFEIESRFLSDWEVCRKLSKARSILGDAFSREVGPDDMDELERLLTDSNFWTLATAFDSRKKYKCRFVDEGFNFRELEDAKWDEQLSTIVDRDWLGRPSSSRFFAFTGLWSRSSLFVRFDCGQNEPFIIEALPRLNRKTIGLWERDVCEIFIAPDKSEPKKYFEFEVAPTGEWLDLAIDMTCGERVTDWEYTSGMEASARIEDGKVTMAMKIPWEAFGRKPKAGDVWLGNIFRCVGKEPDRGYLAWRPTMTEKPNFHVPEAFGEFHFV